MKKNDTNSPFSPDFLPIVDGVMVYEKMYFFTDQALSRSASKVKSAVCCVFLSVALRNPSFLSKQKKNCYLAEE